MITSIDHMKVENSVGKVSLLYHRNLIIALGISLTYHILIVAGFSSLRHLESIEFWMLLLVDTLLIALGLTPVIGLLTKRISWVDPIFWLGILFLGMSGTFFLAFLMDQEYVFYLASVYGYSEIISLNFQDFIFLIIKAELLLIAFFFIVFYLNRDPINIVPIRLKVFEKRAALFTFLVLFGGGYFLYFSALSPGSFLESITINIGSIQEKQPELGTARFAILSEIGLISMTLGIVSLLSYTYPKSKLWSNIILFSACFLTIISHLGSGSRIGVFFSVVEYLMIAIWFGFQPSKKFIVAGFLLITLIIGTITVIRGNSLLEDNSTEAMNQILTGEASQLYFSSVSSPVDPLLAMDRVRILALIIQHLEENQDYLLGESIVAGIVNFGGDLLSRIGFIDSAQASKLYWANEVILIWLYGSVVPIGTLPPSLPGEFYMQLGWFSFIGLSLLFAWILLFLRKKLALSNSLISRWLLLVTLLRLVFLLSTEVSAISSLLLYFPPILVVYGFMVLFFANIQSPKMSPSM